MIVCFGCHAINPHTNSYTRLDTEYKLYEDYAIHDCGGIIQVAPRHWCPPKKNNKRAWKRVANGEWLWDRRRVVRIGRRHGHGWYRVELPTHKPGQKGKLTLVKKNERTTADMGG
jgi:hypothetical protein